MSFFYVTFVPSHVHCWSCSRLRLQYESETSSTKAIVAEQFLEAGRSVKNKNVSMELLQVQFTQKIRVQFDSFWAFPYNAIPVF